MRPPGFHHTEETKRKMSLNHGRWNKGLTKKMDKRVARQSESLKQHWKEYSHPRGMLGKKHSEQTKRSMSMMRRKENNGNWKGGVTESTRLFRKTKRYQRWRRAVLRRDNYLCQRCGSPTSIAHHIKPVEEYPSLRFSLENGMSVCSKCHNQIHKRRPEDN